ncbi:hypothetical protein OG611_10895 [Streptomyces sp. NBC_01363]|nr:hypothetical protein [Streptomyces sp. NBC_01363]MCX4731504.1 hypothetical protein [Streptomyces sp. NBC_01363]
MHTDHTSAHHVLFEDMPVAYVSGELGGLSRLEAPQHIKGHTGSHVHVMGQETAGSRGGEGVVMGMQGGGVRTVSLVLTAPSPEAAVTGAFAGYDHRTYAQPGVLGDYREPDGAPVGRPGIQDLRQPGGLPP